jgi:predicted patatin/cPLA2 family phospholipase
VTYRYSTRENYNMMLSGYGGNCDLKTSQVFAKKRVRLRMITEHVQHRSITYDVVLRKLHQNESIRKCYEIRSMFRHNTLQNKIHCLNDIFQMEYVIAEKVPQSVFAFPR